MKYLFVIALFLSAFSANSANAACNIKALNDKEDGAVFYTKEHRLYRFVDLQKVSGGRTFCSESDAEKAGFKQASQSFSDSTARVVECVEDGGSSKCGNYVMGIYSSLKIYGQVCGTGTASRDQILESFVDNAKRSSDNLDIAKYYGTTNVLMDAFPCRSRVVADR
jgi:hypothetical protein